MVRSLRLPGRGSVLMNTAVRIQTPRFQFRASTTPCRSAQHLRCVHKDVLLWMHHRRRRKEIWHRDFEAGTPSLHQDRLHILLHRAYSEIPMWGSDKSAKSILNTLMLLLAPC